MSRALRRWLGLYRAFGPGPEEGAGAVRYARPDPGPAALSPGAGWYMVELGAEGVGSGLVVCLCVEGADGAGEEWAFHLTARPNGLSKRLIFLPGRPGRVRVEPLEPLEAGGPFSLRELRLLRVTPGFARRRLLSRLHRFHPRWQGQEVRSIRRALRREARASGERFADVAMRVYGETFDATGTRPTYSEWLARLPAAPPDQAERVERVRARLAAALADAAGPVFCLAVYVPELDAPALAATLASLRAQAFPDWTLKVVAEGDPVASLRAVAGGDDRVAILAGHAGESRPAAWNRALAEVRAPWVATMAPGDALPPDALLQVAEVIAATPEARLIYGDHDLVNRDGVRSGPHFKPDWNPELALGKDYVARPAFYRRAAFLSAHGFREEAGKAAGHDLLLRVTSQVPAGAIRHVPAILYHARSPAGGESEDEGRGLQVVEEAARREHPEAGVEPLAGGVDGYRVRWPLPEPAPLVSLIIPTRDGVEMLRPCVQAILARTDYPDFEILIVDNDSRDPATLRYLEEIARDPRVRVLEWPHPFNFSAINNHAVARARGAVIALVNDDVEPVHPEWLAELVSQACRPGVGCVGAKLRYPDGRIQHAGIILGIGGVAGHGHRHFPGDDPGYLGRLQVVQNVSAVTGACLVVERACYEEVGGLNERELAVAFNDVDLCLRVQAAGYRNLWTPFAEAIHHESVTRNRVRTSGFEREVAYMRQRWGHILDHDPAYNPNLTRAHEDFSLR